MKYRTFLVGVVVGVFLSGVTVAVASIPDSGTQVISGCYTTKNGTLRVIDYQAGRRCLTGEVLLQWNQRGIQGAMGLTGAQGPQGVAGPQGLTGPQGVGAISTIATTEVPRLNPMIGPPAYQTTTNIYNGIGIEIALSCYGYDLSSPKYVLYIKATTELRIFASVVGGIVGVPDSQYVRGLITPTELSGVGGERVSTTNYTLSLFSSSASKRIELQIESVYNGNCVVRGGFVQSS